MPQRKNAKPPLNEADIQLAVQAINEHKNFPQRRAAKDYKVAQSTLSTRLSGTCSRRDWRPKSMRLEATEERVIVQHILKLDERGYPPRLPDVEDMANVLLAERSQRPISKN